MRQRELIAFGQRSVARAVAATLTVACILLPHKYLTSNHSVVLLSNRGKAIDLDKFWEKLSGLIDNHAED